jgi:hypothetical protein
MPKNGNFRIVTIDSVFKVMCDEVLSNTEIAACVKLLLAISNKPDRIMSNFVEYQYSMYKNYMPLFFRRLTERCLLRNDFGTCSYVRRIKVMEEVLQKKVI